MEPKVHYSAIGAFVIALTAALVVLIMWMSAGLDHSSYKLYQVFLEESVSGLSIKAPVKYNGVVVGYVAAIKLVPSKPKLVMLILKIQDSLVIREDTTATLDSQGLTGISDIGLRGGSLKSPVLIRKPGDPLPIIQSRPSLFTRLDTVIRDLSENTNRIVQRIDTILDERNEHAIRHSLNNLEKLTQVLAKNTSSMDESFKNIAVISHNTAIMSKAFPQLSKDAEASLEHLNQMTQSISKTSERVRKTFVNSQTLVSSVTNDLLPQTYNLMTGLSDTLQKTNRVLDAIETNPSVIIRGHKPPPLGPGEK